MKMNNIVIVLLGGVVGTFIGGIVALLFAPQSGKELRARLQQEAVAERQQLQARYDQAIQDLGERVDKMRGDVQSLLQQNEMNEELVAETA